MLMFCIILKVLVTASLASKVSTIYKLTSGEKLNDIILDVARETSTSESVGLRLLSADKDVNEPLTYTWMENRNYVDGYSYYEKIYVDGEFDETLSVGNVMRKIQGPLTVGSKVIAMFAASDPFTRFHFNIIDQIFMTNAWPFYEIRFNLGIRLGGTYAINSRKNGGWQDMVTLQTDENNFNEMIISTFEGIIFDGVATNRSHTTSLGDTPTCVALMREYEQPILHRLVYIKGH